jgi:predicted metal-dependent hydrolase
MFPRKVTRLIEVDDIQVEVVLKQVKNVNLRIIPPAGQIRVSAPKNVSLRDIHAFVLSKLGWIRRHQEKMLARERKTPCRYVDMEVHSLWGRPCHLHVSEKEQVPSVDLDQSGMILTVRPRTNTEKRRAIVEQWYRDAIKKAVVPLVAKWEPIMGVHVAKIFLRRMKTKWGSCHPRNRTIRLNTELARKPLEFLEYIVVHEMVHLLEPSHNRRFASLMDQFLPEWREHRRNLHRIQYEQ